MKSVTMLIFLFFTMNLHAAGDVLFIKEAKNKFVSLKSYLEVMNVTPSDIMCYKGPHEKAMSEIKKLARTNENFFCDGCGGGFAFRRVELIRGFVSYDLVITVESEVVAGDYKRVTVKPCF